MARKPKESTVNSTWNPIISVPRDTLVRLKTVTGIVCKGKVPKKSRLIKADRYGPKRLAAYRTDNKVKIGDVRAIGWK